MPLGLKSNYQMGTAEANKQVSLAMINATRDPEVLQVPQGATHPTESLPSWVPDWSNTRRV